jgi:hypothetical protein
METKDLNNSRKRYHGGSQVCKHKPPCLRNQGSIWNGKEWRKANNGEEPDKEMLTWKGELVTRDISQPADPSFYL